MYYISNLLKIRNRNKNMFVANIDVSEYLENKKRSLLEMDNYMSM